MPGIVWDELDKRTYEFGLDKGVLYLPDGSAVPWNGLTSVVEKSDKTSSPVYYDGTKVNDIVVLGDFSATMSAITYPDEFMVLEGLGTFRQGVHLGDQKPKRFGLSYRTKIGNELNGENYGYKIHIIYNILAFPNDKTYASVTSEPNISEFEWNITAIPEEIPGFLPTAHVIFNSLAVDPWFLEDLEKILYGDDSTPAALPSMSDLIAFIAAWARIRIVDNGDGTWTAISARDGFISIDEIERLFTIVNANATYSDAETYVISNTVDM